MTRVFTRADLLALTADGLTQLANAGLVKRAQRELEAGQGPRIEIAADGLVEAHFADGTQTRLPLGKNPGEALCSCPASGMCRHRVSLVLAYQQAASLAVPAGADVPEPVSAAGAWSPADILDSALEEMLTPALRSELQRLARQALEVHLESGLVPSARLPMATVRFLVPGEIAYARCDCAASQRCAHVVLAVQAFRAGRAQGLNTVTLGQRVGAVNPHVNAAVQAVQTSLGRLLREGVVAAMPAHGQGLAAASRAATEAGATWLALALESLEQQIHGYEIRSARYAEQDVLALAVELHARTHAHLPDGGLDEHLLGIGEAMETAMATARLISLGARAFSNGKDLLVSVLLADTDTGSTLVFEKNFTAPEPGERLDPAMLDSLRFGPGLQVKALARGQLLTAVARRRADGLLALGAGRGGKTSLMPHAGRYELPAPLRVDAVSTLLEAAEEKPPSFLRPRHRVRDAHLFRTAKIIGQSFSAGAQHWQAAVELEDDGGLLILERHYDAGAPQALEILFAAFDGYYGPLRQIAGPTRVEGGQIICDPWALSADTLIVPDVDCVQTRIEMAAHGHEEGSAGLLERISAWLAEALHQGTRNLARDYAERGYQLATQARSAGYEQTAHRLDAWLARLHEEAGLDLFGDLATRVLALREG